MRRRDFIKVVGSITVWPLVAQAQQPETPVIGFLSSRSPDKSKHVLAAFHKGLSDAGFIEGTNEQSSTDGHSANMRNCLHWQPTS